MGILELGVLGAGIVGTTTALELQKRYPSARVTLLAERFCADTTSHGAAGIFRPGTSFSGPNEETTREWINNSYEYYRDLVTENCGVKEISGYVFTRFNPSVVRNRYLEGLVPVYRRVTEDELTLCPGGWKHGAYFQTLLIDCSTFLPWALARFEKSGGKVEERSVKQLSELDGRFDVLVNCSGMGAKWLCGDPKLVPIRGQVVKVSAPWLDNFYYGDFDTYIIPCGGGRATLGGSRHFDSLSTDPCRHDGAAIWERCTRLLPRLASAPRLGEWVGLRPHRDPVRVEPQLSSNLKVVHNYGHGGYGITTAPGTAKNAVDIVHLLLSSRSRL